MSWPWCVCVGSSTHDVLADVPYSLQGGLLHVLSAAGVRHVSHQLGNELRPLAHWDLGTGDPSHALGGRAGPVRLRAQGLQHLEGGGGVRGHPPDAALRGGGMN